MSLVAYLWQGRLGTFSHQDNLTDDKEANSQPDENQAIELTSAELLAENTQRNQKLDGRIEVLDEPNQIQGSSLETLRIEQERNSRDNARQS